MFELHLLKLIQMKYVVDNGKLSWCKLLSLLILIHYLVKRVDDQDHGVVGHRKLSVRVREHRSVVDQKTKDEAHQQPRRHGLQEDVHWSRSGGVTADDPR